VFPCARTDASAIKSTGSRQLTIDFAEYDVKRPEYCRDISEHMSARQEIHCVQNVGMTARKFAFVWPVRSIGDQIDLSDGVLRRQGAAGAELWGRCRRHPKKCGKSELLRSIHAILKRRRNKVQVTGPKPRSARGVRAALNHIRVQVSPINPSAKRLCAGGRLFPDARLGGAASSTHRCFLS
jgi:hypothetical protein